MLQFTKNHHQFEKRYEWADKKRQPDTFSIHNCHQNWRLKFRDLSVFPKSKQDGRTTKSEKKKAWKRQGTNIDTREQENITRWSGSSNSFSRNFTPGPTNTQRKRWQMDRTSKVRKAQVLYLLIYIRLKNQSSFSIYESSLLNWGNFHFRGKLIMYLLVKVSVLQLLLSNA